ncbi:MAG: SDR family oxidoreductase [Candidatus Saccharibacteria bacterium]|nr:SDR family oxidoreductase [Candidatus Saccharibacteria bacterium]
MKIDNILITGATGAFGKYLLKELLTTDSHITALVRAENDEAARQRIAQHVTDKQALSRVKVLKADLTKINLGLSNQDYAQLHQSTTAVLHAAASTRFDLSLADARRHNVTTLKNVLGLIHGSKKLVKFGYVSTAFVAGKQSGLISERELDASEGFVNTYDQTKFEAESLVRTKMHDLPVAIYRPSLIVAPDTNNHHAAVVVLNLVKNNLLPILPGQPDDLVDLISADKAAKAITNLFTNHFTSGETHHIVSGKYAPTLETIVAIAKQPNTKTIYAGYDTRTYDDMIRRLLLEQPALEPIYRKIDCFIKYLCYTKEFAVNSNYVFGKPSDTEDIIKTLRQLVNNG